MIAFIQEKNHCLEKKEKIIIYNNYLSQALPQYMLIQKYFTINTMPYLSSGKIDKKALLALALKEPKSNQENFKFSFKCPLVRVFEKIFKIENISLEDDFFSLGGHSLLALELAAHIKKEMDIQISVTDIFLYPIIKDLDEWLISQKENKEFFSKKHTKKNSCITTIKMSNNPFKLFLVHPIMGTIQQFHRLANYLTQEISIYGIEDPGLWENEDRYFFNSLEEMAAFYLHEIRKIQPRGPYVLGGLSFGATIAVEMVRQLRAIDEEIEPVIILDGWATYPKKISTKKYLENYVHEQYDHLQQELGEELFRNVPPPCLKLYQQRAKLLEHYCWGNKHIPDLILFKAKELLPVIAKYDDPYNYWQNLSKNKIKRVLVPGTHESMFSLPNLPYLAQAIDQFLFELKMYSLSTETNSVLV